LTPADPTYSFLYEMNHISYTELRQNLARYLDEAVDSRAPIVVTRQGGKGNVVMLSEAEFAGWQETVHLLSNPANAERLLRSIRAAAAGATRRRELAKLKPGR
jgi:antitoxin YefM